VSNWEDCTRTDWNDEGRSFVVAGLKSMSFVGDAPHDGSAWYVRVFLCACVRVFSCACVRVCVYGFV